MTDELALEIEQTAPYSSLEHAAQISIIQTSSQIMHAFEQMLRPHGITATQFNVLRILRGAGPQGLCRNEIAERMVNRMPDVTRLLDRMEEGGYIARERSREDRRMVRTVLTGKGRRLLEEIDEEVVAEQKRPFRSLAPGQLQSLISMLSQVRQNV